jgi:hypothetical protein
MKTLISFLAIGAAAISLAHPPGFFPPPGGGPGGGGFGRVQEPTRLLQRFDKNGDHT